MNAAQRAERRRAILDAAARCFRRSGFRGASISDICQESGIGVGNLYHYFDSKEAIVEAIVAEDGERAAREIDELDGDDDLIARLRLMADQPQLLDADDGYAMDGPLTAEIMAESGRNPRVAAIRREADLAIRRRLTQMLRNAQARRTVNPDIDAEDAALLMISLFEGLTLRRLTDSAEDAARGFRLAIAEVVRLLEPPARPAPRRRAVGVATK